MTRDLSPGSWAQRHTWSAADFTVGRVEGAKGEKSVSVVLPAREVAGTIGEILDVLIPLERKGLIDELVVMDSGSQDGTARVATQRGARVVQRADVLTSFGPPLGKGDGIWRGLAATSGDIVVMVDTDTLNFGPHFFLGLVGPLLEEPSLHLVKGSFRRPLRLGDTHVADEGGRVTELVARPLINLYVPQLAGFAQPLAGEVAARRDLLGSISFPVGYGVEIGMLIDALRIVGLEGMGQVDLGVREDAGQSLRDLTGMAYSVLATVIRRIEGEDALRSLHPGTFYSPSSEGLQARDVPLEERPPLNTLFEDEAAGA